MNLKDIGYLKQGYSERKDIIKNRLKYFKTVGKEDDKRIFAELCFCLLTPQSKAKICDAAIQNLVKTNLLYTGNENDIKDYLIGVRFNNNKTNYIIEARKLFTDNKKINIKNKLSEFNNIQELREWLVDNIKGLGWKESSHFLRNIGHYENMVILDRHILKNLLKHGAIEEIPETLTDKKYFEIEEKFKEFAKQINIPIEEIDLLFFFN